ncbi:MAG: transcription-repair coupling factor [Verrucomicrobia bacterium]|nr:transcription-repair coupling factor [Verrucomicrobiota bacterium]
MTTPSRFTDQLAKSPRLAQCSQELASGSSLLFEGLSPATKALLLAHCAEISKKSLLILTGAGIEEFTLYNDLPLFSSYKTLEFPAWETLPSENIAPSPDIVGARIQVLRTLIAEPGPFILLCPLQAALQKVPSPDSFKKLFFTFTQGERCDFQESLLLLEKLGYEKKSVVCEKGEFAVRGGIIDLFPITSPHPFRIEFWGNAIESIRIFDPASQKSALHADAVEISEAKESYTQDRPLTTILDYLPSCLIVFDELEALEDRYASLTSLGARASPSFLGIEQLLDLCAERQRIFFTKQPIEQLSEVEAEKKAKFYSLTAGSGKITFEMFLRSLSAMRITHSFETLGHFFARVCHLDEEPEGEELLDCLAQIQADYQLFFVCQSEVEEQSLLAKLQARQIHKPHFWRGYLSKGITVDDAKIILFPYSELTNRVKVRREKQRTYYHSSVQDAFDISPGEAVVHFNHGIGRYLGVEKKPNYQGIEEEYFLIEYADRAKLFVPLTQAHLINKYIGSDTEAPKLHGLGNNRWKKQREQTEKAIIGYASDLLKLYAEREMQGGFVFPADSPDTISFEEEFPYIETEDQLSAISSIKEDMCSEKAMDRLVCGDVGYGKTEVAMRAAFKAVLDGRKQVAVLTPTTVLALQHYESFRDRMSSFGVRVELLSRFRSAAEIKKTLEQVKTGAVDIVIGTHRLIQKDIEFKDLGLVIVDEEQRFGVKAKEHLKQLKTGVDSLALSATPIPRTLYMSLIGARDLSVINTPPQDRLPIKTVLVSPDDQLIQTALLRELNRDGQAYFIHNRIESIFETASHLKKLLPKARIAVGHGQMDPDEIDLVFHGFKKGEIDILVATSIVENGIDIPNANTILIDNADMFGIADLYQLRGRVGRWNRRAYAYFLVNPKRRLSDLARKRLDALTLAGGYGGGMKVAMRDLEIRGAGDILGMEQSGHVTQIGFHLYCKLLKRTINSLQGKAPSWTLDTKIEMPFDARLPAQYVNDVNLRMELYQRLGEAVTPEEVDAIWEEVLDRFGKPPEQAKWLYHQTKVKVFAAQMGFTHVKLDNVSIAYERKQGHTLSSGRTLIQKIKGPEDMEQKICQVLSTR